MYAIHRAKSIRSSCELFGAAAICRFDKAATNAEALSPKSRPRTSRELDQPVRRQLARPARKGNVQYNTKVHANRGKRSVKDSLQITHRRRQSRSRQTALLDRRRKGRVLRFPTSPRPASLATMLQDSNPSLDDLDLLHHPRLLRSRLHCRVVDEGRSSIGLRVPVGPALLGVEGSLRGNAYRPQESKGPDAAQQRLPRQSPETHPRTRATMKRTMDLTALWVLVLLRSVSMPLRCWATHAWNNMRASFSRSRSMIPKRCIRGMLDFRSRTVTDHPTPPSR